MHGSAGRLGLDTVVLSPGSRSTPLALAAARNSRLEAIPVLDERSAGFFALGLAGAHASPWLCCVRRVQQLPISPLRWSRRQQSGTPLLVLTADRPAELRDCAAGQTIDQVKFFGTYVRQSTELALPEAEPHLLDYLRQVLARG